MKRLLSVLFVAAAPFATLHAQRSARVDTTVSLSSGALIEVGLTSGVIIVRGADRSDAQIRAESDQGRPSVVATSAGVRIGVDRSGWRGDWGDENRFEIEVPRGVRVIASGTSADIAVRDTRGEVEARTTSGDIAVSGARGRVSVSSTSSDIDLRDIEGNVRVSGVSGEQSLTDVSGSIELNTVSGSLRTVGGRVGEFRAESVSGDITFGSRIESGGRYEVRAHSGEIVLQLDERTPLVVGAQTFSGEIYADVPAIMLPTPAQERGRSRRVELSLGGSEGAQGPRFLATTFSGDIRLVRRGVR
jgi:hypothetical protein